MEFSSAPLLTSSTYGGFLMSTKREESKAIVAFLLLLLMSLPLFAQSTQTGNLSGTITDDEGNPLPGVVLILSGDRLFADKQTVSNEKGSWAFRHIPSGVYSVKATMSGFASLSHTNLRVALGASANHNWKMRPESLSESLVVTSAEPLVDTSSAETGQNFVAEEIKKQPVGRDPWSVLNMVPGVNMSRTDVGGNNAGTQARFAAPGVDQYQNGYYIDGINTTDTAATGASSQYYNFDRFEEVQVSTGGHDPSIQTAGVVMNMVSRSGSNTFEGNIDWYYQDDGQQSENSDTIGQPNHYNKDAAIRLSGPIIKDKLWFAIGAHRNQIENYTNLNRDATDFTELEHRNIKLEAALGQSQRLTVSYAFDEKTKPNRDSSVSRGPIASWYQGGPGHKEFLTHEWFINENLILETGAGRSYAPFSLAPQSGVDYNVPAFYNDRLADNGADGQYRWTNAYGYYYDYLRERDQYDIKLNWFIDEMWGASHNISIGGDVSHSENYADSSMPGDAAIILYTEADQQAFGHTGEAWISRSAQTTEEIDTTAFYFQDIIQKDKWTFNVGFRYDNQKGSIQGGDVVAPQWWTADFVHAHIFQTLSNPDIKDVVEWNDFLPRLQATYDIKGDGRQVLKANFSQYASVLDTATFEDRSPVTFTEIDYYWDDLNGDGQWTLDETNTDGVLYTTGTVQGGTPIDDDLSAPTITEFTLSYDHMWTMMEQTWAASVTYISKETEGGVYERELNKALQYWSQDGTSRTFNGVTYNFPEAYIWNNPGGLADEVITNYTDRKIVYDGILATLRKPYGSDKWQAFFSMAFNDQKVESVPGDGNNPNTAFGDDKGSGAGVYASEFTAKLNFGVKLPWDINSSMFVRYDSGVLYDETVTANTGDINTAIFYASAEEPALTQIDLGVNKTFKFGGRYSVTARLDGFNITNEDTVIGYTSTSRTSSRYNQPNALIPPRIYRISLSVGF
jgi:hypothetical protein